MPALDVSVFQLGGKLTIGVVQVDKVGAESREHRGQPNAGMGSWIRTYVAVWRPNDDGRQRRPQFGNGRRHGRVIAAVGGEHHHDRESLPGEVASLLRSHRRQCRGMQRERARKMLMLFRGADTVRGGEHRPQPPGDLGAYRVGEKRVGTEVEMASPWYSIDPNGTTTVETPPSIRRRSWRAVSASSSYTSRDYPR